MAVAKAAQFVQIESCPSVGLETDLRPGSRKLTGFALGLEDQILHLAVFARALTGNRERHYER